MKQGGQCDLVVYYDYYTANNARVNSQATFFYNKDYYTDIIDLFYSLLITQNLELQQSLLVEKWYKLK